MIGFSITALNLFGRIFTYLWCIFFTINRLNQIIHIRSSKISYTYVLRSNFWLIPSIFHISTRFLGQVIDNWWSRSNCRLAFSTRKNIGWNVSFSKYLSPSNFLIFLKFFQWLAKEWTVMEQFWQPTQRSACRNISWHVLLKNLKPIFENKVCHNFQLIGAILDSQNFLSIIKSGHWASINDQYILCWLTWTECLNSL